MLGAGGEARNGFLIKGKTKTKSRGGLDRKKR